MKIELLKTISPSIILLFMVFIVAEYYEKDCFLCEGVTVEVLSINKQLRPIVNEACNTENNK